MVDVKELYKRELHHLCLILYISQALRVDFMFSLTFQTYCPEHLHHAIGSFLPFSPFPFNNSHTTTYTRTIGLFVYEVRFRADYNEWYSKRVVGEDPLREW